MTTHTNPNVICDKQHKPELCDKSLKLADALEDMAMGYMSCKVENVPDSPCLIFAHEHQADAVAEAATLLQKYTEALDTSLFLLNGVKECLAVQLPEAIEGNDPTESLISRCNVLHDHVRQSIEALSTIHTLSQPQREG